MPSTILQRAASGVVAVVLIFISVLPTSDAVNTQSDTSVETMAENNNYDYDIKIIDLTSKTETKQPSEPIDISKYTPAKPVFMYYQNFEVIALAKVLYNECRGVKSKTERACVAWTICNRVDDGSWGDTIIKVITYPNAFAYSEDTKVLPELYQLAEDVLSRWNAERNGETDVGRVLPSDYMYFRGDGEHNWFRNAYAGDYDIWDYSLESPYEN